MAMHPKRNEVAAEIHGHMADHDAHGYTQGSDRYGGSKTETIYVCEEKEKHVIGAADYDCSSSDGFAWQCALKGTAYEDALGWKYEKAKMTYTGNMEKYLLESGLFTKVAYTTANVAKMKPGDILLVHDSKHGHTGMYQGNGMVTEALSNEKGGILGGKKGDQTSREICRRKVTAYPYWKWIFLYNGKADVAPTPVKYVVLKRTNVRTGRALTYQVKDQVVKGQEVMVDRTVTDKYGRVWGHVGKYRWFVISSKVSGVRAKRAS